MARRKIDWKAVGDFLASGFGSVVNDIRHKYEEVFFGRQVTDTPGSIHAHERPLTVQPPALDKTDSAAPGVDTEGFRERWAIKPRDPTEERAHEQDQDHGFDR